MSDLFENFEGFKNGQEIFSISEYPLYTDNPRILGAFESQPISLLNTVIQNNKGIFLPRIVLRYFNYEYKKNLSSEVLESKIKSYEYAPDEVSYLLNLRLGIRTKLGSCMREFNPPYTNNTNYGFIPSPQYYPNYEKEVLIGKYPMIPSLFKDVNLFINGYFEKLISLKKKELNNVTRAAKLYSDALFFAERSPKISWILFVSAIEAAAESKRYKIDNLRLIENEFPDLYGLIVSSHNSKEIFQKLTTVINLRAQEKFIKFIKEYFPIPQKRTDLPQGFLIDWDNFNEILKKIYEYRSNTLHSVGTGAFPKEMCLPPYKIWEDKLVEIEKEWIGEKYYGNGEIILKKEDAPMNLAKFEEIVRLSLLKWIEGIN